jgi:hypothetical protein
MALYTKQQLIDAYIEATGGNPSEVDPGFMAAEVIRVQAEIDAKKTSYKNKVDAFVAEKDERIEKYQDRIIGMESDAKTIMKKIALQYIADQTSTQNDTDNEAVEL